MKQIQKIQKKMKEKYFIFQMKIQLKKLTKVREMIKKKILF